MAKYGMSMCVLGMANEFADRGVGVNALWPKTAIATSAVKNVIGEALIERSRNCDIMSDAAHVILTRDPKTTNGNFFVDEDILREEGVTDFDKYAIKPGVELAPDFFL